MSELVQKALRQEGSLLSWCLFPAGALLAFLSGIDQSFFWLPFLISIAIIGLPHGAADWILLKPTSALDGAVKFALYSLAGAAVFVTAIYFPIAVFIGFLALTIFHFGWADEKDLRRFDSPRPRDSGFRLGGISRMAVFFAIVLLADSRSVIDLMQRVVQILPGSKPLVVDASNFRSFAQILLIAGVIGWTSSLVHQIFRNLGSSNNRYNTRRLGVELTEGCMLLIAALTLHPVFSVGLYFLTWHALRHSVLLTGVLPGSNRKKFALVRKLADLHFKSYPLLLPVFPLMFVLIALNGSLVSPVDWVAALLVICIIFTLPHHCIVDRAFIQIYQSNSHMTAATPVMTRREVDLIPTKKAS